MPDQTIFIFLGLVAVAGFFLAQGLVVPVFGESRHTRKRLQERLSEIDHHTGEESITSIMREKYLRSLSPFEKAIESLPVMESLSQLIEQSGHKILAYRLVLISIILAVAGSWLVWEFTRMPYVVIFAFVVLGVAPIMKIRGDRTKRFEKFEDQLADCIDVMRRAVQAGHPFSASLRLVAEDMEQPAAGEFELTFSDLNYGNDVRRAMLALLARLPSVTVMAFVTAILVQKETGGNLAEILSQLSTVIRSRFKFQRKVKTLSAEGRMSAWVLAFIPLGLFMFFAIFNPAYLDMMFEDERGQKMLTFAAIWSVIGMYFLRRIIRIEF